MQSLRTEGQAITQPQMSDKRKGLDLLDPQSVHPVADYRQGPMSGSSMHTLLVYEGGCNYIALRHDQESNLLRDKFNK